MVDDVDPVMDRSNRMETATLLPRTFAVSRRFVKE
jgi:hypothetical protein